MRARSIWRSSLIILCMLFDLAHAPHARAQLSSPSPSPAGPGAGLSKRIGIIVDPNMSHQGKVYLATRDNKKACFYEDGRAITEGVTGRRYEIEREKCRVSVTSDNGFFSFKRGSQEIDGPNCVLNDIRISPPQERIIRWPRIGVIAFIIFIVTMRRHIIEVFEHKKAKPVESAATTGTGDLPAIVGPYSIVERLGRGGMATVYKVRDKHGDFYALKVPHCHIFEIPEFKARFLREAEIIKTLHHPNIVRLYDYGAGQEGETPYICLEYVTGTSLRTFLENNPVLPIKRVAKMISDIAGALGYAHSKGIVHRDIKPDNIMLAPRGVIKVMDLGIARAADKQTLTATGTTLGTPHYIAPEQVEMKKVDGRADLYSLGVIFYQMLTSKLPFEADDPINVILMHVTEDPALPTTHNALIPKELEAIVMKLLRKNPAGRYETAGELIAALKKYL
jgi:hypothetical protein